MEVVGDEFFDGALGVVVSGLLEALGEGLNEWQHGLFVVAWFDAEVFDAVVDDALGGLEVAGDGGGVAVRDRRGRRTPGRPRRWRGTRPGWCMPTRGPTMPPRSDSK